MKISGAANPLVRLTEENLGRSFWRQPEGDKSEQGEKEAWNNEYDHVEDRNAFNDDGKSEVWKRFHAARVLFNVLDRRTTEQFPLVTLHVTRYIDLKREQRLISNQKQHQDLYNARSDGVDTNVTLPSFVRRATSISQAQSAAFSLFCV